MHDIFSFTKSSKFFFLHIVRHILAVLYKKGSLLLRIFSLDQKHYQEYPTY